MWLSFSGNSYHTFAHDIIQEYCFQLAKVAASRYHRLVLHQLRIWPTTSVLPFPHQPCSIASASDQMQPNQSSSTNANGMESSRAHGLPVGSLGIFLPVCLLAIFLSCVVCAYSWQSANERRLDFEDNRKRKRTISKYGSSCTLKTRKSMPKVRVLP